MQILFLTQVLPYPLDAGPKTRAYYVLRYLVEAGHDVTLLSFVRATDTKMALDHLRSFCADVFTAPMVRSRANDVRHLLRSLPGQTPFIIARDWAPAMVDTLGELCASAASFDAVHADQLWMAPYALLAGEQLGRGQTKLVLDQHNAVFQIPGRLAASTGNPAKRALLNLEARKLAAYEAATCAKFDNVAWVTNEDLAVLETYTRYRKGECEPVIPICVDPSEQSIIEPVATPRRVTFLGGLHWPPNAEGMVWFTREVWPLVVDQCPTALLTVIGKDPPDALRISAQAAADSIEITGYLNDPTPYLAETAAFIVPLHAGGGMRVKILDAWQWGLPVVSTTIGAEGIQGVQDESILYGDTPETFAAAVLRLLHEPELNQRLRTGGRHIVGATYNWRTAYQAWNRIYC